MFLTITDFNLIFRLINDRYLSTSYNWRSLMDSKNILQLYNANNISYIGIGRKETKKVIHICTI